MQQPVSLKSAERKAFQATFADGLWDVMIGCVFLMFALAPLLSESLGDFWISVIFLPFWGLVYLAIWLTRRHVVAPRIGKDYPRQAAPAKRHRSGQRPGNRRSRHSAGDTPGRAARVAALLPQPDALIIDAVRLPQVNMPQSVFNFADSISLSVAAASILAKVTRDRMLIELDAEYPTYQFARHKGYGTQIHQAALQSAGPCAIHRRSFKPISALLAERLV